MSVSTAANGEKKQYKYDVVILGASGKIGGLIAIYLSVFSDLRLLLVGRGGRFSSLKSVARSLARFNPNISYLEAGASYCDLSQDIRRVVCEGNILINCIKYDFLRYMRIASICIDAGVSYFDTSLDISIFRPMIQEYHSKMMERQFIMLPCLTIDAQLPDLCANVKIRDYVLPSQIISAEIVSKLNTNSFLNQLARSEEILPALPISWKDLLRLRSRCWRWDDRLGVWSLKLVNSQNDPKSTESSTTNHHHPALPSASIVMERTANIIPDRNSLMRCPSFTAAETLTQLIIFCIFAVFSLALHVIRLGSVTCFLRRSDALLNQIEASSRDDLIRAFSPLPAYIGDDESYDPVEVDVISDVSYSPWVDESSTDPPASTLRCTARGPKGLSSSRCTAILVGLSCMILTARMRSKTSEKSRSKEREPSTPGGVCTAASVFGTELLDLMETNHGFFVKLSHVRAEEFPWRMF